MFAFMAWADSLVASVLAADRRVVGGSLDSRLARGSSRAHGTRAAESARAGQPCTVLAVFILASFLTCKLLNLNMALSYYLFYIALINNTN